MSLLRRALEPLVESTVALSYGAPGYRLRAGEWDPRELDVDCRGRTALVTGANSGIGRAVAHGLARRGASVILVCRNPERGREALEALRAETGSTCVRLEFADVSLVRDLARLVRAVRESAGRLDVLVNNAGVVIPTRETTSEGLEKTFATNVLAGFALTCGLRPLLERAAVDAPARVVTVTSGGMYTQRFALEDPQSERSYSGLRAYAQSKRAQVLLNGEFAARLGPCGIVSSAMHPGWAATPGVAGALPRFESLFGWLLRTPEQGADTALWLSVSEAAKEANGRLYLDRRQRREHVLPWTRSPEGTGARLYDYCAELLRARGDAADFGL